MELWMCSVANQKRKKWRYRLRSNHSALTRQFVAGSYGHSSPVPVCLQCTLNRLQCTIIIIMCPECPIIDDFTRMHCKQLLKNALCQWDRSNFAPHSRERKEPSLLGFGSVRVLWLPGFGSGSFRLSCTAVLVLFFQKWGLIVVRFYSHHYS